MLLAEFEEMFQALHIHDPHNDMQHITYLEELLQWGIPSWVGDH